MLGLTVISCKKEVQTIPSADIDTIPAMDSTNMNLPPIPSDTMNTRNRDSAMTTPK